MAEKPSCKQCREMHEAFDDEPPCFKCLPALWPENQPIYSVYSRVSSQHIMAECQPIDLNLMPVFKMMDLVGIRKEDQLFCLDMIQKAYHEVQQVARDKKK